MASDSHTRQEFVRIAPAPPKPGHVIREIMRHACQACAIRKLRCDKISPACSKCLKTRRECSYESPRARKKKLNDDLLRKVARYESILAQHGLLDTANSDVVDDIPQETQLPLPVGSISPFNSGTATGTLRASQGKSRYIESHIWNNLGDEEIRHISDDEEADQITPDDSATVLPDPFTGAFLGMQRSLLDLHPSHTMAMIMWETYAESIEPLCKALHIPSTGEMVKRVSLDPITASRQEECLLFAIYHAAIFSMTEEQCIDKLGQARPTLMPRYHMATRQALVNASFLKTTEMSVLQAFFLSLLTSRSSYDPHTYWMLTGNLLRIALRMGLHRDAEKLGLSPFDVKMRRRLFYQIFPMDGRASQIAGTEMTALPESWDTRHPLNINDDQIWPGMTEKPTEKQGATDMIFCLSRACVGLNLARAGKPNCLGPFMPNQRSEINILVAAAEREVEEKFIRYCDIVNPLHFLTMGLARSGITAMRLKVRFGRLLNQTATDAERKDTFQLAQKTLDTDAAVHAHMGLSKYQWFIKPFFLWGTWDSFVLILSTIWKRRDLLAVGQIETAWKIIEQLYKNHEDLMVSKAALHTALRRFTLKAWDSHPTSDKVREPEFIVTLRSLQEQKGSDKLRRRLVSDPSADTMSPPWISSDKKNNLSLEFIQDLDLEADDWIFWNDLIQDHDHNAV
ncbi:uncharacterized protein N7483_008763 [Penicillium malachiteum]|uniref:uncharacterized protein n=1 Tax=Penicillium malachiteum TaxID=1324776 RepID=UPI0025472FD2|nr:uncharacterized protein N7483_008763 [Penicillium malachiteum]KAJ5720829.1 hypothetical protein N7483_008763 [Penicillium malachiteum]